MGLSDIYSQRPWAPAQDDLNQFRQGVGQLTNLAQAKMSMEQQQMNMDAAKAERARQNAPISPWQEAVADLMQEHITPKEAATKLRMKLQDQSGAAVQMPQPMGMTTRTETPSGTVTRGPQYTGDETGMARPPLSQTSWRQGMTNHDFGEYMNAAGQLGKVKNDRDYLAEIRERNKGTEKVAEIGSKSKEKVAEFNAKAKAKEHQKDLDSKTKDREERAKYHKEFIQLGYAKLEKYTKIAEERAKIAGRRDPVLDALVKMYSAQLNAGAKIESSNSVILDEERAKGQVDKLQNGAIDTEAKIRAHINSNPVEGHSTEIIKRTEVQKGAQGATANKPKRQWKVGDQYRVNGEVKTVKEVDEQGRIVK